MRASLIYVSFVGFASKSLAAPNAVSQKTSTVDQVAVGHRTFPSAAHLVYSIYQKYAAAGATAPAELLAAVSNETGTVTVTPSVSDEIYTIPIQVGGQALNVTVDTAGSDLWVFSTLMQQTQSVGHDLYDPNSSSTAKELKGYTFNVTAKLITNVGVENVTAAVGYVYQDTVAVGKIEVANQAVEAATDVFDEYVNSPFDGNMGLGFKTLNTVQPVKQSSFFDNVENSLAQKLFAANLKHQQPGSFDFGFINKTSYTGEIAYTPVNSTQGYWLFNPGGYSVGEPAKLSGKQGYAVADTASPLLYLPNTVVSAYYSKVARSFSIFGYAAFICNETLPDFHTGIGGRTFTIPGQYMNFTAVGTSSDGPICIGGIQSNEGLPFSIYGNVFLKTVYAVFDQTKAQPRLGFAKKAL